MPLSQLYRVTAASRQALISLLKNQLDLEACALTVVDLSQAPFKASIIYQDDHDLRSQMQAKIDELSAMDANNDSEHQPKLCFLFTGQGAQYPGMAATLYTHIPYIRKQLDHYAAILKAYNGTDYLRCMIEQGDEINQTRYTQPCTVMLQLALAAFWQAMGVEADLLIGHSVGEFSASANAGFYQVTHILQLIAKRAELMQSVEVDGGMLAVASDKAHIDAILKAQHITLDFAAFNGPQQIVMSGQMQSIAALHAYCRAHKIKSRQLTVSHPFHSRLMQPITQAFADYVASIPSSSGNPHCLLSNVTGQLQAVPQDGNYWSQHILQPVHFVQSVETAWDMGARIFLEIGPDTILAKLAKKCLAGKDSVLLSSMQKKQLPIRHLLMCACILDEHHYPVRWDQLLQSITAVDSA